MDHRGATTTLTRHGVSEKVSSIQATSHNDESESHVPQRACQRCKTTDTYTPFSSNFYVAPTRRRNARQAVSLTAGAPLVATRGVEKILGDFRVFRVFRSGPNVPYPGTPKLG